MKIRPGAPLINADRKTHSDGRTDMTKPIDTFIYLCEDAFKLYFPKNVLTFFISYQYKNELLLPLNLLAPELFFFNFSTPCI